MYALDLKLRKMGLRSFSVFCCCLKHLFCVAIHNYVIDVTIYQFEILIYFFPQSHFSVP